MGKKKDKVVIEDTDIGSSEAEVIGVDMAQEGSDESVEVTVEQGVLEEIESTDEAEAIVQEDTVEEVEDNWDPEGLSNDVLLVQTDGEDEVMIKIDANWKDTIEALMEETGIVTIVITKTRSEGSPIFLTELWEYVDGITIINVNDNRRVSEWRNGIL